jgi:hypothetical protein
MPGMPPGGMVFVVIFIVANKTTNKGALQVTSSPISKVYVDGKLIGQTPLCKCEVNDMITTGIHSVRLVSLQGNLEPFEEKITIAPSVLTVVDRTFGPGSSSQGSVISLTSISDKKDAQVLVVSFPDKSQVFLDNNPSGLSPILLKGLTVSDHEIKITKDGYKDKTLKIRTVAGYKLYFFGTFSFMFFINILQITHKTVDYRKYCYHQPFSLKICRQKIRQKNTKSDIGPAWVFQKSKERIKYESRCGED